MVYVSKVSSYTKFNEPCLTWPISINLNSNEVHYYPLMVSLDRWNESCTTLDDLSSRSYVWFKMITRINE